MTKPARKIRRSGLSAIRCRVMVSTTAPRPHTKLKLPYSTPERLIHRPDVTRQKTISISAPKKEVTRNTHTSLSKQMPRAKTYRSGPGTSAAARPG